MFRRVLPIRAPSVLWKAHSTLPKADKYGIPLKPTWSVNELLSSYPKPSVSSQTLTRLHELSALVPPAEGTAKEVRLKEQMSELVRLVEAVKLIDTQGVSFATRWDEEDADRRNAELPPIAVSEGQELLKHAARTKEGFYLVDADRRRNSS